MTRTVQNAQPFQQNNVQNYAQQHIINLPQTDAQVNLPQTNAQVNLPQTNAQVNLPQTNAQRNPPPENKPIINGRAVQIITTLGFIAGAVATVAGVVAFVASFLFATLATLPILITAAQITACACLIAGPGMFIPSLVVKIMALFARVNSALIGDEHLKAQKQIQQQLGQQLQAFRNEIQDQMDIQARFQQQLRLLQNAIVRDDVPVNRAVPAPAPVPVAAPAPAAAAPVVVAAAPAPVAAPDAPVAPEGQGGAPGGIPADAL